MTNVPMPGSVPSSRCSHRPATAKNGAGTGSTSCVTAIPAASNRTPTLSKRGATATTSSSRFNDDKPYDRFVKEQSRATNCIPTIREAQTGTGFYRVGTNRDMLFKVEDLNRVEKLTDTWTRPARCSSA